MNTIRIYNENRLTRQPFFKQLIAYLDQNDEVRLRQIHKDFSDIKNIDRLIDSYIEAGFIRRDDKRYSNAFTIFEDKDFDLDLKSEKAINNQFKLPFFVRANSKLEQQLDESIIYQELANDTNQIKLDFSSNLKRTTDTLANYFYKLEHNYPLTELEKEVYQIIGDCDPNYALKYMTTFLLKFMRKDVVKNKRDIFIQTLEKYGYIQQLEDSEKEFTTSLIFSDELVEQVSHEEAKSYIQAQLAQRLERVSSIRLAA